MQIDVAYDASTATAPAAFFNAIAFVVNFYDSLFSNSITVHIDVGYGEVGGTALGASNLGQSISNMEGFSYAAVYAALASTLPATELPQSDPTGLPVALSFAEAQAIELLPQSSGVDGYVGFSSTMPFTYNPAQQAVAGEYDFIGTAEHEISEVLGRLSLLSTSLSGTLTSVLDLYRYAAPGMLTSTLTTAAYFSANHGATGLAAFNTSGNGDAGDWAASATTDAYQAFSPTGTETFVTVADLAVMQALGYTLPSNVIGTSSNFGGYNEQDVFLLTPTGQLVVWGYSTSGVLDGGLAFWNANGTALILSGVTVAGTGQNFLGTGGADVFLRSSTGQLSIDEVNADGTVVASQVQTPFTLANHVAASFTGNSTALTMGSTDSLTVIGGGNVIVAAAGDSVSIGNANNVWDYVAANGCAVTLLANTQATIGGGGNVIVAYVGDEVGIAFANGVWDYVAANGCDVSLGPNAQATVGGGGNVIWASAGNSAGVAFTNGVWDYVAANGSAVSLGPNAQTTIGGTANSIWVDAGDSIGIAYTAGTWDYVQGGAGINVSLAQGAQTYLNFAAAGTDNVYLSADSDLGLVNSMGFIAGSNAVEIEAASGAQSVYGFAEQDGDWLDLRQLLAGASLAPDLSNLASYVTIANGTNTVVTVHAPAGSDTVTLFGVTHLDPVALLLPFH